MTDETLFPGEYRLTEPDTDEAERIAGEKYELRRAGLARCMEQDWFREWMMEKLMGFSTFTNPFGSSPTGFPDPHQTFFHLGMKAAGWALFEDLEALAPELTTLMRREAMGRNT